MNKIITLATTIIMASSLAHAAGEQSDAHEAHESTVKTESVKYSCQSGKKITVNYGFNKQGIPTYAEAELEGKTRFMPINLNTTDIAGTNFGDENNFSLSADQMELDNYRQASINILNPASEILYKACEPVKK